MLGHSIVSQHFMEPEGSILNSQEPSTCSYPELGQSYFHTNNISFPFVFLQTFCIHFGLA
jgi:hypothetical protein